MSICQAEKGFGWEKSVKNCRGLGLQNPELRGKILPMSGIEIKSSSRLENLVVRYNLILCLQKRDNEFFYAQMSIFAILETNVLCPLQHLDLKVVETKFLKSSKFDLL